MESAWTKLPLHILLKIMRYLSMSESYHAALTCRAFFDAFQLPQFWRTVEFSFTRGNEKLLLALEKYGRFFRNVTLKVEQSDKENRRLATEFLRKFSSMNGGQINRLKIDFVGTNPLFYGGQEFVEALDVLFDSSQRLETSHSLEYVDLSKAPVMYTDELFLNLSKNHRSLRYLNIQTKQFICKIHPDCMRTLVESCQQLRDLRLCHSSLSNEVLSIFANTKNRSPLKHLSILCRRQEKYFHHDLTELTWLALVASNPNLAVTLKFDPTCPLEKVREIMKSSIPVRHLFMEMYTNAHEIALATEYYHNTLTKLVVQARQSPTLESALLDAAEWCHELKSIHVMCVLDKFTVEEILRRRPELTKDSRNFTLKHELEPHPWVTDEILDELPIYVEQRSV